MGRLMAVMLLVCLLLTGCGSSGDALTVEVQREVPLTTVTETTEPSAPTAEATETPAATEETAEAVYPCAETLPSAEEPWDADESDFGCLIVPTEATIPGRDYVLNKNTKKFHYPVCSSVPRIKEKNREDYSGSREDVLAMGYVPCKICTP